MRTWLCASPLSMRMLGTSNGVSTQPMPSSMSKGCFGSGAKVERMVGAALRCRQAIDLVAGVEAGLEAFRRHGVVEAVAHVVLARPHHLDRRAAHLLGQQRRLDGEVALGLAAEAAAEQRGVQRHLRRLDAERRGDVVARLAGALHRRPDLPACRRLMRATAAGGSMVAWAMCGRVVLGRDHLARPRPAPCRRRPRCARPCRASCTAASSCAR